MAKTKTTVFHVNSDGTTTTTELMVDFDSKSFMFEAKLPSYVAKRVNDDTPFISAYSVQELASCYEGKCEAYQRWRLMTCAQPMLMLSFVGTSNNTSADIAIAVKPVYVCKDDEGSAIYERIGTTENVKDFGDMGCRVFLHGSTVFLPDIPEVRAKAKRFIDSVATAGAILNALVLVPDNQKLAAFMDIGETNVHRIDPVTETTDSVVENVDSKPVDDPSEEL